MNPMYQSTLFDATQHAIDRSRRQGVPMYVYGDGEKVYVRSKEEGVPDGTELITTRDWIKENGSPRVWPKPN